MKKLSSFSLLLLSNEKDFSTSKEPQTEFLLFFNRPNFFLLFFFTHNDARQ